MARVAFWGKNSQQIFAKLLTKIDSAGYEEAVSIIVKYLKSQGWKEIQLTPHDEDEYAAVFLKGCETIYITWIGGTRIFIIDRDELPNADPVAIDLFTYFLTKYFRFQTQ
ncbi:MAG: hypothetical protein QXG39_10085 [Candidatus Aenigmatarchaeota archaeon]